MLIAHHCHGKQSIIYINLYQQIGLRQCSFHPTLWMDTWSTHFALLCLVHSHFLTEIIFYLTLCKTVFICLLPLLFMSDNFDFWDLYLRLWRIWQQFFTFTKMTNKLHSLSPSLFPSFCPPSLSISVCLSPSVSLFLSH